MSIKGGGYLLSKVAIHLSENFLLKIVVVGLELILIAYTVLFCTKEDKGKTFIILNAMPPLMHAKYGVRR